MTYTPNIPQPTDDPSQSQSLILANFQNLNNQYGLNGDHVAWTAVSRQGQHKKVTWFDQTGSIPAPVADSVVAFAVKNGAITMPYYKRDASATQFALSPIKAYASLSISNVPVTTISDGFNLNVVSTIGGGTFTINMQFIDAMRTATSYGILISESNNGVIAGNTAAYQNIDASNFKIFVVNRGVFPQVLTIAALEF